MDIAQVILIAAIVIYMIIRRFAGRPLQAKSAILPLALTAWGLYQLRDDRITALDVGFLVVSAIIALGAGAARGATIRLYTRDGHLWQRYRPVTLAVWVLVIALRIGLSDLGQANGVTLNSTGTLLATLGASLIAETAVVSLRAARTAVPYAPKTVREGNGPSRRRASSSYR
ncbi:hypothetical protein [Rugosimonospora acidiphila]